MLQVRNLKVSYDGVLAISDVSLEVGKGKLVALVGGNGNGKSTTLRAIAGLNSADQGQIHFNGAEIQKIPAHKRVPLGLSLVPEGRRLFARLTVERNLELGAYTRS
ncbi:MAG TPA: ATP-binding cassette domain-containing protein, partial [Noviherbaspirillum sp.]